MPSTTRYKRGDIVLVPFPFTDLSSSKRRPALVISPDAFNDQMQDLVVAAITSQLAADHPITIEDDRFGSNLNGSTRGWNSAREEQSWRARTRVEVQAMEPATRPPESSPPDDSPVRSQRWLARRARTRRDRDAGEPMAARLWVLLTVDEPPEFLRTTRRAIYAMVEGRQLPGVIRIRRRVLLRADDHDTGWTRSARHRRRSEMAMSVRIRPYRTGGWEVDITVRLPNGSECYG